MFYVTNWLYVSNFTSEKLVRYMWKCVGAEWLLINQEIQMDDQQQQGGTVELSVLHPLGRWTNQDACGPNEEASLQRSKVEAGSSSFAVPTLPASPQAANKALQA